MKLKSKKVIMLRPEEILSNAAGPRTVFDSYELAALGESIKANGIIQPLTVRKNSDKLYELIAGERRLRAAVAVGIKRVPCVLCEADPCQSALIALIENLQRCDLTFFEEAEAIEKATTLFGLDRVSLCESLGIAQSTLSNKLRLLKLEPDLRERILRASLTERHARALLCLDEEKRSEALDTIIAESLSIKETDAFVNSLLQVPKNEVKDKPPLRKRAVGDLRLFTNSLNRLVSSMQDSGIQAISRKKENDTHIEYTIKISKASLESKGLPYQMLLC